MPITNVVSLPVSSAYSSDVRGQTVNQQERVQKQEPKKEAKPQIVQSAAAAANLEKFVFNRKLQFVVDHNSNQVIVKVIDKETDKVIKVLPPEELQRLHRNLKDTIGFLFDERV